MAMEFDVKITHKDMYRFNMYHAYTGFQGIFSIVIGIAVLVVAWLTLGKVEDTYSMLYFIFGIIFLVYTPLSLWSRSKRQILLSPVLKETLRYRVDEEGVHVSVGEQTGDLEWKMIYKIVTSKNNLLIYSSRVNAYVLPLEQVGDHYQEIKKLAEENLEKYRLRMK